MRTTLTLDPDVAAKARRGAAKLGKPLKEVVNAALRIGSSITHYRISAKLGEGGMGEACRAGDAKLGREAAIKVLPPSISHDPQSH